MSKSPINPSFPGMHASATCSFIKTNYILCCPLRAHYGITLPSVTSKWCGWCPFSHSYRISSLPPTIIIFRALRYFGLEANLQNRWMSVCYTLSITVPSHSTYCCIFSSSAFCARRCSTYAGKTSAEPLFACTLSGRAMLRCDGSRWASGWRYPACDKCAGNWLEWFNKEYARINCKTHVLHIAKNALEKFLRILACWAHTQKCVFTTILLWCDIQSDKIVPNKKSNYKFHCFIQKRKRVLTFNMKTTKQATKQTTYTYLWTNRICIYNILLMSAKLNYYEFRCVIKHIFFVQRHKVNDKDVKIMKCSQK